MSKIKNAKPKSNSGGYERVFGNKELGSLITKVQSTVISNGTELERIIQNQAKNVINNIDDLIEMDFKEDNVYLISKKSIKKSKNFKSITQEPDFLILLIKGRKHHCHIIELKDGDMFDTKKSKAERDNLVTFKNLISSKLPFTTSIHICCFNQTDKETIAVGFKNVFSYEEILTGKEFCDLLEIDYEEIIKMRKQDEKENLEYFVEELLKIPEVEKLIEIKYKT
ncbi:MAG: hypothetical protein LBL93_04310 [Ruminococcus sp.]|nr:hypothetical protein [Ruminococcus sp.]